MAPVGWTIKDTNAKRVVLETQDGWLVDRGTLQVDSLYRVSDGPELHYALCWTDPRYGERLAIFGQNDLENSAAEVYTLFGGQGRETWHLGEAALAIIAERERALGGKAS